MDQFTDIATARDAAQRGFYRNLGDIGDEAAQLLEPLFRTGAGPVDAVVRFPEIVFARPKEVPKSILPLAAGLADLAHREGWHSDGNRAGRMAAISKALRRRSGEKAPAGAPWPGAKSDPAPMPEYAPPPTDAATEGEEGPGE
jgi:hypothetical protein